MPPFRPSLLVLALAAALSRPARAGDPPPADQRPAPADLGEELVIRGKRPPQAEAAAAPGASVTVIDAARFAGEAKGAAELLATAPGVAVTAHGGPGQLATVSIRGSGADHVKVLVDGLPLNTAAGGGVDLSSIPSAWLSRVEVVRGTEGVHHGSGALGGVVNVVTPAPSAGAAASLGAGSLSTLRAEVQGATRGERWGLLASASGFQTRGRFSFEHDPRPALEGDPVELRARANAGAKLAGALVKGYFLLGEGRVDALAEASAGARDLPGSPYDPTADDWQREGRALAAVRFRRALGERLGVSASSWTRLDRLDARLEDLGGIVVRQRGVAGAAEVTGRWSHPSVSVSVAAEAGGERLDADGIGSPSRAVLALTAAAEANALRRRLRGGPGIRLERSGEHAGVSAKVGGSLVLAGPLSLRASAGRTYRVPSFAELHLEQGVLAPNPDLAPEVGIGGDGALVLDGRFGTASLGTFASVYRDLVVYHSVSFRRLVPVNADRTLMRGFEIEAAGAPLPRLAGLAGALAYTYTDSRNLRGVANVVGKDVTRRPRHRLYARVAAGRAALAAHVEAQWISRQFLDLANQNEVPPSFALGAGASARILGAPDLRLHVEVRNLLDDRSLQDGFGYPLPGRTVFVTLRAASPAPRRT